MGTWTCMLCDPPVTVESSWPDAAWRNHLATEHGEGSA